MISAKKLVFLLNIFIQISIPVCYSLQLIQVQTLTRHGQRSPRFTFHSDPYKHLWTQGPGQLTSKGINQLKEVGSFLRNHYHQLLPIQFHRNDIYIQCSDADRTINSGLSAMSTLFKDQIIPIHTVPERFDLLLKLAYPCPMHDQLLDQEFKLHKYQNIIHQYKGFFKQLEKATEIENVDFHKALGICDAMTVWNDMNLTLPFGFDSQSIEKCIELGDLEYTILYSNINITRYRGGPLVDHVIDNMIKRAHSFINDESGLKMIGYFAHDSTISGFLGHLKSFNQVKPPLASTLIVELYYQSPPTHSTIISNDILSQFFVRLLLRNDTTLPPHILKINACETLTNPHNALYRLDIVTKCVQDYRLTDVIKQCALDQNVSFYFPHKQQIKIFHASNNINDGKQNIVYVGLGYVLEIVNSILITLGIVFVILILYCCTMFRKCDFNVDFY